MGASPYVYRPSAMTRADVACRRCGVTFATWGSGCQRARTCDACQRIGVKICRARRARHRIAPALRAAVIERDGYRCTYCGTDVCDRTHARYPQSDNIELDHRTPIAAGGETTLDNLCVSCVRCNRGKRDAVGFVTSRAQP